MEFPWNHHAHCPTLLHSTGFIHSQSNDNINESTDRRIWIVLSPWWAKSIKMLYRCAVWISDVQRYWYCVNGNLLTRHMHAHGDHTHTHASVILIHWSIARRHSPEVKWRKLFRFTDSQREFRSYRMSVTCNWRRGRSLVLDLRETQWIMKAKIGEKLKSVSPCPAFECWKNLWMKLENDSHSMRRGQEEDSAVIPRWIGIKGIREVWRWRQRSSGYWHIITHASASHSNRTWNRLIFTIASTPY